MKLKLARSDDPILKQVCADVRHDEILDLDLLDGMRKTCSRGKGIGLAAPQVGIAKRVIFVMLDDDRGTLRGEFLVNPVILDRSTQTTLDVEGCLSYPGVFREIARSARIEVEYFQPLSWIKRTRHFRNLNARVIQHEVDHLNGICLVGEPGLSKRP